MATNIDTLTIEIEASADTAVKKVNELTQAMSKLKISLSNVNGNGIKSLTAELQNLSTAVSGLSSKSINRIKDLGTAFKGLSGLRGLNIDAGFAYRLRDLVDVADNVDDRKLEMMSRIGTALQSMQGAVGLSKDASTNLQAIIDVASKVSEDTIVNLERLGEALGKMSGFHMPKIRDLTGDSGGSNSGSNIFQKASEGLKNLWSSLKQKIKLAIDSSDVKKATKETTALSKMLNSLTRIAFYRLIRSAIKAIGQALKEGAENAYFFSQAMGGDLATALDTIATKNFTATNQLGAAWATLKQTLEPILLSIISLIQRFAEVLTQLFAMLGGKSTYLKATDYAKKYATAASKGAKSTEEWKNQLMGFDEINRLDEPSDSSGGSGKEVPDYSSMFEETPLGKWFTGLKQLTMDWWETVDLEPITKAWKRLSAAVQDFVSIVDDALYWAYTNVLLPLAKWTIEKGAPAVVNMLGSAFETLNTVLRKLAPYFKDFYENIIKPFAEYIGEKFIDAMNDLTETFESLKKKVEAASSLSDFVKSLDGKETAIVAIATALTAVAVAAPLVSSALGLVKTAFSLLTSPAFLVVGALALVTYGAMDLYQKFPEVQTAVDDVSKKLKEFKERAGDPDYWGELGDSILNAINTALEAIGVKINFNSLKESVSDALGEIELIVGTASLALGAILAFSGVSVMKGIGLMAVGAATLAAGATFSGDSLKKAIEGEIGAIVAIVSVATLALGAVLTFTGASLPLGLGLMAAGAAGLIGMAAVKSDDIIATVKNHLTEIELIAGGAMLAIGVILTLTGNLVMGIPLILAGAGSLAAGAGSVDWDAIGTKIQGGLDDITERFQTFRTGISEKIDAVKEYFSGLGDKWDEIRKGISEKVDGLKQDWADLKSDMSQKAEEIKNNVLEGVSKKWQGVKDAVNGYTEDIKTSWSNFKGDLSKKTTEIKDTIWQGLQNKWQTVKNSITNKVESLNSDFDTNGTDIENKSTSIEGFFSGLGNTWAEVKSNISTLLGNLTGEFGSADMSIGSATSDIASYFVSMGNTVHAVLQDIITGLATIIAQCQSAVQGLNTVSASGGKVKGSQSSTQQYASGGLVDTGELFIAREAGPELVGTIGGQTAVANNDQIIAGISEGVFEAVVAAMAGNGGGSDQPIYIYMDGKQIAQSTTKYQRQYARATG